MSVIPTEIEKIATAVAVGSIFCFGVYLVLDSSYDSFYAQFEGYVTTASFGVIAAIPTLAFLYIVGSLISLISDFVFQFFNPQDYDRKWNMLARVIKRNNETLSATFFELHKKKKILESSVMPLVILGIGVAIEYRNLPDFKYFLIVSGAAIMVLASILPFFTGKVQQNMELLMRLVENQLEETESSNQAKSTDSQIGS